MTKEQFAKIMLSRWCSLDMSDKGALLETLFLAENEVKDEHTGEIFDGWAQNVMEIMFSETFEIVDLDDWKPS